jgi:hypothetical protein
LFGLRRLLLFGKESNSEAHTYGESDSGVEVFGVFFNIRKEECYVR